MARKQITRQSWSSIQQQDRQPVQLMTIKEVQVLLQISRPHVYQMMGEGLPAIKLGRALRFDPTDIVYWLDGQKLA